MSENKKSLAIARVVHEALRAWCAANGQQAYPAWSRAPKDSRQSTIESVLHIIKNPNASPGEHHEQWVAQKRREGWRIGEIKNRKAKTHPLLVTYDELPEIERTKDRILIAITKAIAFEDL